VAVGVSKAIFQPLDDTKIGVAQRAVQFHFSGFFAAQTGAASVMDWVFLKTLLLIFNALCLNFGFHFWAIFVKIRLVEGEKS
jgi:hypothetical protein